MVRRSADRSDVEYVRAEVRRAGKQMADGDTDGARRTVTHAAAESAELGDLVTKAARAAGLIR